jgi:hypothetical protein
MEMASAVPSGIPRIHCFHAITMGRLTRSMLVELVNAVSVRSAMFFALPVCCSLMDRESTGSEQHICV